MIPMVTIKTTAACRSRLIRILRRYAEAAELPNALKLLEDFVGQRRNQHIYVEGNVREALCNELTFIYDKHDYIVDDTGHCLKGCPFNDEAWATLMYLIMAIRYPDIHIEGVSHG